MIHRASAHDAAGKCLIYRPAAHIFVGTPAAGEREAAAQPCPVSLRFFQCGKRRIGLTQSKDSVGVFAAAYEHRNGPRFILRGKNGEAQLAFSIVEITVQPR